MSQYHGDIALLPKFYREPNILPIEYKGDTIFFRPFPLPSREKRPDTFTFGGLFTCVNR